MAIWPGGLTWEDIFTVTQCRRILLQREINSFRKHLEHTANKKASDKRTLKEALGGLRQRLSQSGPDAASSSHNWAQCIDSVLAAADMSPFNVLLLPPDESLAGMRSTERFYRERVVSLVQCRVQERTVRERLDRYMQSREDLVQMLDAARRDRLACPVHGGCAHSTSDTFADSDIADAPDETDSSVDAMGLSLQQLGAHPEPEEAVCTCKVAPLLTDFSTNRNVLHHMSSEIRDYGLCQEHRLRGKVYRDCFVESDAVVWLQRVSKSADTLLTKEQALRFIRLLQRVGFTYRLNWNSADTRILYRFRRDASQLDRVKKMGWVYIVTTFRSRRRFLVLDIVRHTVALHQQNPTQTQTIPDSPAAQPDGKTDMPAEQKWSLSHQTLIQRGGRSRSKRTRFRFELQLSGQTQAVPQVLTLATSSAAERADWLHALWLSGCTFAGGEPDSTHLFVQPVSASAHLDSEFSNPDKTQLSSPVWSNLESEDGTSTPELRRQGSIFSDTDSEASLGLMSTFDSRRAQHRLEMAASFARLSALTSDFFLSSPAYDASPTIHRAREWCARVFDEKGADDFEAQGSTDDERKELRALLAPILLSPVPPASPQAKGSSGVPSADSFSERKNLGMFGTPLAALVEDFTVSFTHLYAPFLRQEEATQQALGADAAGAQSKQAVPHVGWLGRLATHAVDDIRSFGVHLQRLLLAVLQVNPSNHDAVATLQACALSCVIQRVRRTILGLYRRRYRREDALLSTHAHATRRLQLSEMQVSPRLCELAIEGTKRLQQQQQQQQQQEQEPEPTDQVAPLPTPHKSSDPGTQQVVARASLPPRFPPDVPFREAIECFCLLADLDDTASCLRCISRVSVEVCACVDKYRDTLPEDKQGKPFVIGAEDLLMIKVFIIARAVPYIPGLYASLQLLQDFLDEEQRVSPSGYYLATTQAATEVIVHNQLSQTPTDSSEAEPS